MIQEDLDALQDRVASLVALVSSLRHENQSLRQSVSLAESEARDLTRRMEEARLRVERLLEADPLQTSLISSPPAQALRS